MKNKAELAIGKNLFKVATFFPNGESFHAVTEAEALVKSMGFSLGSMQSSAPIGIAKGDVYISKWHNLGDDASQLDGALISDDFRDGAVSVYVTMASVDLFTKKEATH